MKEGLKYGLLTATGQWQHGTSRRRYEFVCDCGETVWAYGNNVTSGSKKSCGCIPRPKPPVIIIHGMSYSAEYKAWDNMWTRCTNENTPYYSRYGGRGISVCDRWKSFSNFYMDMGNKPHKEYSIDRINNNGDYEPTNCRWATIAEQSRNKNPYKKRKKK